MVSHSPRPSSSSRPYTRACEGLGICVIAAVATVLIHIGHNENQRVQQREKVARILGLGDNRPGPTRPRRAYGTTPVLDSFTMHFDPNQDPKKFRAAMRCSRATVEHIAKMLRSTHHYKKRYDANGLPYRGRRGRQLKCCMLKEVSLALHYLGTLENHDTIAGTWGIRDKAKITPIVRRFVRAVNSLEKKFVYFPDDSELQDVAEGFRKICHLPRCVGAMDGTHIEIPRPTKYAGDFLYYKGKYTRVIHACVDHRGRFRHINCGMPGSNGDLYALKVSDLPGIIYKTAFSNGCYVIGDDIYPLRPCCQKGFGHDTDEEMEKTYNALLDRGRAVVENAFGRLKNRFRRLKYLNVAFSQQKQYMAACCILHNIIEDYEGLIPSDDDPCLRRSDGTDMIEPHISRNHPLASRAEQAEAGLPPAEARINEDVGQVRASGDIQDGDYDPWSDDVGGLAVQAALRDYIWPIAQRELQQRIDAGLAVTHILWQNPQVIATAARRTARSGAGGRHHRSARVDAGGRDGIINDSDDDATGHAATVTRTLGGQADDNDDEFGFVNAFD